MEKQKRNINTILGADPGYFAEECVCVCGGGGGGVDLIFFFLEILHEKVIIGPPPTHTHTHTHSYKSTTVIQLKKNALSGTAAFEPSLLTYTLNTIFKLTVSFFLADVPPVITDTDVSYLDSGVARAGVLINTVSVTDTDTPIITNLTVTMSDPTSKFNLVPTEAGCKYKFVP